VTGQRGSPLTIRRRPAFRWLRRSLRFLGPSLRSLWRSLRQWSGDAAYETYLARTAEAEPLDAKAFYLDSLRRRYRGEPDRCC
jgi:hypothetical protein